MPDPADAMKQIDGLPTSLGHPPQTLAAVTIETAQQPSAASQPEATQQQWTEAVTETSVTFEEAMQLLFPPPTAPSA